MTKKGIRQPTGKISALISFGLGEGNVHQFIKEKHAVLTMAGARNASNLPQEINRRISFLEGLFDHQEQVDVLLSWVEALDQFVDATDPLEAIKELTALGPELALAPESTPFWQSILVGLSKEPTSQAIWSFLKQASKKTNQKALQGTSGPCPQRLDEALRIASGDTVTAPKDPVFANFISGIAEMASGNRDAAEGALTELRSISGPTANEYAELASILLHRRFDATSCPRGLEVRQAAAQLPNGLEGEEGFQALGRMMSLPGPGHRFFEIFALFHEGNVYKLGKTEAIRLFPTRGSAIAFAGKMVAQSIPMGSEWLLSLREIDGANEHPCHFSVEAIHHRLGEVISIPHKSSEPDLIRYAIGAANPSSGNIPVFELADGCLLPMVHFPPNFDEPLGFFHTLTCYETDGRRLVVDQIGKPVGFLDCAPPDIAIRRLFRARSDMTDLSKITKAQVAKLADLASKESDSGGFRSSVERAKLHVTNLLAANEEIAFVVQELLKDKDVLESLETEKGRILAEFERELDGRRTEIDDLSLQKQRVMDETKKLREKQEALAGGLREHLKDAFKKAAEDGLGILSNVALLSPFLQTKQALPVQDASVTVNASGSPAKSAKEIVGGILGFGFRYGLSQGTLCQAIAFSKANGLVGFHGKATPLFQEAISLTLAGNLSATVSLSVDMFGWGDILDAPVATSRDDLPAMSLGEFIALAQRSAVPAHVSIVGANRLPPESYFPELLAIAGFGGLGKAISWKGFDGRFFTARLVSPIFFSMTFAYGKSTFQIGDPLSTMLPLINCDADWGRPPERMADVQVPVTYVVAPIHGDRVDGDHPPEAKYMASSFMKGWAVPDDEAEILAKLGYQLGRSGMAELESQANNMQGTIRDKYLVYLKNDGNEQLLEIFATSGRD